MYTSDTRLFRLRAARRALAWLWASVGVGLFGAVYERFGHGVFSFFMVYAFAFPLLLCTLPLEVASLRGLRLPGRAARGFWDCGVATLTVGSLVRGALEIYGTTNRLTGLYWILGGLLIALALAVEALTAQEKV